MKSTLCFETAAAKANDTPPSCQEMPLNASGKLSFPLAKGSNYPQITKKEQEKCLASNFVA